MRLMGLEALGPKPKTSRPSAQHRVYPYLLRGVTIDRPNQVWAADITHIPMARGFLYLVVVMDWYSRYVLAWRLSKHDGQLVLPRRSRRCPEEWAAGDLQHRPGCTIHQRGVY